MPNFFLKTPLIGIVSGVSSFFSECFRYHLRNSPQTKIAVYLTVRTLREMHRSNDTVILCNTLKLWEFLGEEERKEKVFAKKGQCEQHE